MENFTIHQKLYDRCGQETFMVTRDVNGIKQKYILKKIECPDENFANKAYRELLRQKQAFEEFSGTVPVKEFRVYWETKNSSIHICCLRNVYEVNLLAELQKAYLSNSLVKEKFVEAYLCQLILTLENCHKRNIFHRAIKLSNVVKHEQMKNLLLVDFGIEGTTQFNHKAWQPPELGMDLQDPPDNAKIDIWGIGAVMLCVVCSIFVEPGEEFEELLQSIKEDQKSLDDTCKKLLQRYSQEIIDIIRGMLDSDPLNRLTIMAIKERPYLETTFRINDLHEISKEYRKSFIGTFWALPQNEGTESMLNFLSMFIDCDDRVLPALVFLNKTFIYQNSLDLLKEDKQLVLAAMKNHLQIEKVQITGFQLLLKLVSKCPSEDYLFSCQAVCSIVSILKVIPKGPVLKPILYEFLSFLSLSDIAAQSFGSHGGLQILITMLKEDIGDPFLFKKSCHALWGFCTQVGNAEIAASEGIPADMCAGLKKYSKNSELSKELIRVLFSLSAVPNMINLYCKHNVIYLTVCFLKNNLYKPEMISLCCNTLKSFLVHATFYDNVMTQFRKNNVLLLLVSILWENLQNTNLIRDCFTTLTSIIVEDEENAYSFLITSSRDVKKQSGMKLIRKIFNAHKDNAEVSRNVCNFLDVLFKFDEACHHAQSYNISSWLTSIKNNFCDDEELCCSCEKIIKRLRKVRENL